MLRVIILRFVKPNVIMLNVVAAKEVLFILKVRIDKNTINLFILQEKSIEN